MIVVDKVLSCCMEHKECLHILVVQPQFFVHEVLENFLT